MQISCEAGPETRYNGDVIVSQVGFQNNARQLIKEIYGQFAVSAVITVR